ncbi:exo-beta-N-acetylmuramidase NamZ family protein [Algoriphagus kandeliae]
MNLMKKLISTCFLSLLLFLTIGQLNFAWSQVLTGSERSDLYLPLLKGKKVGIVANQTSIMPQSNNKHVVDFLLENGVALKKVFVPEHGFRGTADAGEKVDNSIDQKTGLNIVSLYGNNKKPSASQIQDLDVLIFDLQDVGVRFFTYISTMHYVMEAAAENGKQVIIFDRPNPLGDYVDGPIRKEGFESFVGMHPIPIVHGLTVGELAKMINGEKWLKGGLQVELEIIPVKNWVHDQEYHLPIKPSPNLPNDLAIRLYPSTCFFEGTVVSLGRGTLFPFQVYGYPDPKFGDFTFTPISIDGMSKNPPHQDKLCYGQDLRTQSLDHQFTLRFLLQAFNDSEMGEKFFNNYFNTLSGTDELKKQILEGKSEQEIRETWKKELEEYKILRNNYLIYN